MDTQEAVSRLDAIDAMREYGAVHPEAYAILLGFAPEEVQAAHARMIERSQDHERVGPPADDDELLAIAARQAERWKDALALLAK